jgi:flagellar basal-body rod protein FlgG
VRQVGAQNTQDTQVPSGLYLGTGVNIMATEKLNTQGGLTQTGNALDVAIQGKGFFQILMPDGTLAYTRDGSFQVNSQGQVVTSAGYQVQPALTVPANATSVTIGQDGTVTAVLANAQSATTIGQLQLADFINEGGLQPLGQNLLAESTASGAPQTGTPGVNGMGTLLQGSVEGSNVNIVQEMVNMIETQRAYEMNSKSIQTSDQMLQYLDTNI